MGEMNWPDGTGDWARAVPPTKTVTPNSRLRIWRVDVFDIPVVLGKEGRSVVLF
jgi:hypothetical protein